MHQTISREEQKSQEQQPANAELSSGESSTSRVSGGSNVHRAGQASGGFLGVVYEWFLQMPVAVVLTVLWLVGVALLSTCVLMLYTFWTLLALVAVGG